MHLPTNCNVAYEWYKDAIYGAWPVGRREGCPVVLVLGALSNPSAKKFFLLRREHLVDDGPDVPIEIDLSAIGYWLLGTCIGWLLTPDS